MRNPSPTEPVSPWRPLFENVRQAVGHRRDEHGVVGSINWLRNAMEAHGANPNVVRNIIYRDKGRLPDKRALFVILDELWREAGNAPLHLPELQAALSPTAGTEQEVLQLLGRDKRRAYRAMIGGIRAGEMPKVLVTGRPGSGKTLLTDYVRQGVELLFDGGLDVIRLEFGGTDLAASLVRLATELGVPTDVMESRLVRIATASAFAVQADAQAELARVVLEAVRQRQAPILFLFHVSQSLANQDSLGLVPLRLANPDVPRVSAVEWLWVTLFEPLARLQRVMLFVTITDLPARAMQRLGNFADPIRLTPPTVTEARRFVKARVPDLSAGRQEEIVQRAGRSFEELRTLTLLAQARAPQEVGLQPDERYIEQLSGLVTAGDSDLRAFLAAIAVLSPPEHPAFAAGTLQRLRDVTRPLGSFELSFLDPVPGQPDHYRVFSRQLARALQTRLATDEPAVHRRMQLAAAALYAPAAGQDPSSAARHLHHLFEARDWRSLTERLAAHVVSHAQVRQVWQAAVTELRAGPEFDAVAKQVAAHYVRLGAYGHPEALKAFEAAAASNDPALRAWTLVKRAEGEALAGRFERAEVLLDTAPDIGDPLARAESALARASIARWRGDLATAAELITATVRGELARVTSTGREARLAAVKAGVWEGMIAKDRGDLKGALARLDAVEGTDDLVRARVQYQRGDIAMRLGRFDTAKAALDFAVELAHRSEALAQEQARYLTRRASLLRVRGDLTGSVTDFKAARARLHGAELTEAETALRLAKVDAEWALTALALGDFEEGTYAVTRALAGFREHAGGNDSRPYRALRGTLTLAIAYACRGLAVPYRRPFPVLRDGLDGPDLRHARQRIDEVLGAIDDQASHRGLRLDARLLASQFAVDGATALRFAEEGLSDVDHEHSRARALGARAAAHMRLLEAKAVLADVQAAADALGTGPAAGAPFEGGDAGLRAQLASYAVDAHLALGDAKGAAATLTASLDDATLSPYHEGLLRAFGESADERGIGDGWKSHRRLRALLGVDGTGPSTPARLPDALVAAWRSKARALAGAPGAPA